MKFSDIEKGVFINVNIDGTDAWGIVSTTSGNVYDVWLPGGVSGFGPPSQTTVEVSKFNLTWKVNYEQSYPKIGHIKKGSSIRLGRRLGKTFIPGELTLFADGFKMIEGTTYLIGRNLNKGLYRELSLQDYRKKWILDKK